MAVKNVTLKDLVNDLDPELKRLLYTDFRTDLNNKPTILDITYRTLSVNNSNIPNFKDIHDTLLKVVAKKATRQYASIADIPADYFNSSTAYIIYINGDADNKFLIAKSLGPIRTFITNSVSKHPDLIKTLFGQREIVTELLNKKKMPSGDVKTTLISNVDIGHISSEENMHLVSPLEEKLLSIIEYGELSGSSRVVKQTTEVLQELYSLQADIDYTFRNTTPEALASIGSKLGEFFVVVTLHTSSLNQKFSTTEKRLFGKLEGQLALMASQRLRDVFLDIRGSNTIKEDILKNLLAVVRTGKNAKLPGHKANKAKTPKVKIPKKITVQSAGNITGISPLPATTKTKGSNLYSLVSLQQLLNDSLQHVIAAKMGSGSAVNVLNYRSGRFAASVNVERMSMSRAGMITAFYSYMKNPYQTFEPGYRQGTNKARDPKLLISSSIREIAATKVANRMRAISI